MHGHHPARLFNVDHHYACETKIKPMKSTQYRIHRTRELAGGGLEGSKKSSGNNENKNARKYSYSKINFYGRCRREFQSFSSEFIRDFFMFRFGFDANVCLCVFRTFALIVKINFTVRLFLFYSAVAALAIVCLLENGKSEYHKTQIFAHWLAYTEINRTYSLNVWVIKKIDERRFFYFRFAFHLVPP